MPVWTALLVAVVALTGGLAVGSQIKSPAQVAAEARPPDPGLITAKIEQRQLTALVTARADIAFADPVSVSPPVPTGADAAVVTGSVPKVGDQVDAGSVLIEVSGRPVFVLPGDFPAYRTLGPGSVGPDVQQLRAALNRLGYQAGNSSTTYDQKLAQAVERFYQAKGYPPPGSDDLTKAQAIRDADAGLADARDTESQAVREYEVASSSVSPAPDGSVLDLSALEQAITTAERGVSKAEDALADAQRAAWTAVPAGEIVFVANLPRRVDAVNLGLGQAVSGTGANSQQGAVVLSGANVEVTAHVPSAQAGAVAKDAAATLVGTNGIEYPSRVVDVCADPSAGAQCDVKLALDDPSAADREALVGNVKVTIEVGSSSAEALVVPVAAVSADAAGQAQVQWVSGPLLHNSPASNQPTQLVNVEVGLAAEGYVEIKPAGSPLHAGDLVVLGIGSATVTPSSDPSAR